MKSFLISALILSTTLFSNKAYAFEKVDITPNNLIGANKINTSYLTIGTGYGSENTNQLSELLNTNLNQYGIEGSAAIYSVNSGDIIKFDWEVDSGEFDFFSDRFYFWDGKKINQFGGRYLAWNKYNSYRWRSSQQFTTEFTALADNIAILALDTQDTYGDTELRINQIYQTGINPKFVKKASEPNLCLSLMPIAGIFLRGKLKRKYRTR